MPITNCKICGKIFESISGKKVCPNCSASEEQEYLKVRSYVKDNPKASINAVSEGTGVPIEKINEYLRKGLLERAEVEEVSLKCQLCGTSILNGNYCLTCIEKLKQGLKSKKDNADSREKTAKSFMVDKSKK
jgi:hypothetical protein